MTILAKLAIAFKNWFNPHYMYWRVVGLIDRIRGLDFLSEIQPEAVGLDVSRSFKSSPSGNRYLKRMLSDFQIYDTDAILDVGCGKGSAMKVLRRFPFARVDGIEISPEIVSIACRNNSILQARNSTVYECDASLFGRYADYNFFYFYNPFPSSVMAEVIQAIENSVAELNREIILLYNNPTCHDAVVASGQFEWHGKYPDQWGHGIRVYSNRCFNQSRVKQNKCLQPGFSASGGKSSY